jgi:hypothetical protein
LKARIPVPNSGAVFALIMIWTPVPVLHFEFLRPRVGYFDRLEIMDKLHFLDYSHGRVQVLKNRVRLRI